MLEYLFQAPACFHQDGVTGLVAEHVIDGLEAVEIKEGDNEAAASFTGTIGEVLDIRKIFATVGKAGEIIRIRQTHIFLIEALQPLVLGTLVDLLSYHPDKITFHSVEDDPQENRNEREIQGDAPIGELGFQHQQAAGQRRDGRERCK